MADLFTVGGLAVEIKQHPSTIRYLTDTGKIKALRANDGSRLYTPEHAKQARAWFQRQEKLKAQKRKRVEKARADFKAHIDSRRAERLNARRGA